MLPKSSKLNEINIDFDPKEYGLNFMVARRVFLSKLGYFEKTIYKKNFLC